MFRKAQFLYYDSVFGILIKVFSCEVLTAVAMTIPAFWAVMPCSLERFLVTGKVVPVLN
jgi:hypothetical protein